MKKLIITIGITFLFVSTLMASNIFDRERTVIIDRMPKKAQQFISDYFNGKHVAYANQDKELFDGSYTVGFTDGSKIEFNSKGVWTDVECMKNAVPNAIIPVKIKNYVAQHYPDVRIIEIERDKNEYDVKLSNRLTLEFDSKYDLIDIDGQD